MTIDYNFGKALFFTIFMAYSKCLSHHKAINIDEPTINKNTTKSNNKPEKFKLNSDSHQYLNFVHNSKETSLKSQQNSAQYISSLINQMSKRLSDDWAIKRKEKADLILKISKSPSKNALSITPINLNERLYVCHDPHNKKKTMLASQLKGYILSENSQHKKIDNDRLFMTRTSKTIPRRARRDYNIMTGKSRSFDFKKRKKKQSTINHLLKLTGCKLYQCKKCNENQQYPHKYALIRHVYTNHSIDEAKSIAKELLKTKSEYNVNILMKNLQ